ncbi:hypothetical protein [Burkholderia territorii]|nr:hypothetical protein [Burkholderia territorii]
MNAAAEPTRRRATISCSSDQPTGAMTANRLAIETSVPQFRIQMPE